MASTLPLFAALASKGYGTPAATVGEDEAQDKSKGKRPIPTGPLAKETRMKKKAKKAKKGKNAPQEVSSKRPVAPTQGHKKMRKVQARDPRFDDFGGKVDSNSFGNRYAFLEDYRADELQEVKNELEGLEKKRRKSTLEFEHEENLRQEFKRRVQQDKQRKRASELLEAEHQLKREERRKVKETGKTPYFHSRGAVRKLVRETKGSKDSRDRDGAKREKKLAGKERKRLPSRRNKSEE